jgi:hypothetical protein
MIYSEGHKGHFVFHKPFYRFCTNWTLCFMMLKYEFCWFYLIHFMFAEMLLISWLHGSASLSSALCSTLFAISLQGDDYLQAPTSSLSSEQPPRLDWSECVNFSAGNCSCPVIPTTELWWFFEKNKHFLLKYIFHIGSDVEYLVKSHHKLFFCFCNSATTFCSLDSRARRWSANSIPWDSPLDRTSG